MHTLRLTAALAFTALLAFTCLQPVAAGPAPSQAPTYTVLAPVQSGELTLFPVVQTSAHQPQDPFLTLDEGLKSGQVEVTEAGQIHGLVRSHQQAYRGDEVNTLLLINNSHQPLLLLAGEIVTGGKQDRIIAKDRIIPAGADPVDLSVFCVEHGRWTQSSSTFGTSARSSTQSFMVQPSVRTSAQVSKDQQQVWDSVSTSVAGMARAAAPARNAPLTSTGSYAKAMQTAAVSDKLDQTLLHSHQQLLDTLLQQQAIGVVVALHGRIVWADLFANQQLLARYWTKLIRSYAAEDLTRGVDPTFNHAHTTTADAQRFLDQSTHGHETSEGESGVYRNREIRSASTDSLTLESLLPNAAYDVHISKAALHPATVFPIKSDAVLLR